MHEFVAGADHRRRRRPRISSARPACRRFTTTASRTPRASSARSARAPGCWCGPTPRSRSSITRSRSRHRAGRVRSSSNCPTTFSSREVEGEIEAPAARAPHLGRPRADAGQRRAHRRHDRRGRAAAAARRRRRGAVGRRCRAARRPRRSSTFRPSTTLPAKGMLAGGSSALDRHARPLGLRVRRAREPRGRPDRRRRRALLRQPHRELAQGLDLRRDADQDRPGRSRLPARSGAISRSRSAWSAMPSCSSRIWPPPSATGNKKHRGLARTHARLPR